MKRETAQKRLAYQESIWAVKEIDLIEDNRKLQLRIGIRILCTALTSSLTWTRNWGNAERSRRIAHKSRTSTGTDYCIQSNGQGKSGAVQGQLRLLSEEKDRMHRDSLSLQKQLDYYKVYPTWDHTDFRVRLNRCKRRWRRQTMCYQKRWHWHDKWSPFKYPAYINITYCSWSWKMNDVPLFEHQRLPRTRATLKSRCKRR